MNQKISGFFNFCGSYSGDQLIYCTTKWACTPRRRGYANNGGVDWAHTNWSQQLNRLQRRVARTAATLSTAALKPVAAGAPHCHGSCS